MIIKEMEVPYHTPYSMNLDYKFTTLRPTNALNPMNIYNFLLVNEYIQKKFGGNQYEGYQTKAAQLERSTCGFQTSQFTEHRRQAAAVLYCLS